MLLIAELHHPEEGEHQGVILSRIGATGKTLHQFLRRWQWVVACSGKSCRINFHLARGSLETLGLASLWINLGILLVAGPSLNPHPHRVLSQLPNGQAGRRQ